MANTSLLLVNGVPRTQTVLPLVYSQTVTVVASGGVSPSTLNTPVTAGTAITLPSSGSYTLNTNSIPNLQVSLNGQVLQYTLDWSTSGAGPNYTAIQLTIGLVTGDVLELLIQRNS